MMTALAILSSHIEEGVNITPIMRVETLDATEQNMELQISNMYTLFNVPQVEKGDLIDKNPEFLYMFQELLPEIQNTLFGFICYTGNNTLDFKEIFMPVMALMLEKKPLYTDFVILYRMRICGIYNLWEGAGDFLNVRGYPVHALMMYFGVCLMRMETRPMEKHNGIVLKKAIELVIKINHGSNKKFLFYDFKEFFFAHHLKETPEIMTFIQAVLNKVASTYFLRHGLCFNTALDCEILYLSMTFDLGFFNKNEEWLVCNVLNLVLNTLDISHGGRRLRQAKHLMQISLAIMTRCDTKTDKYVRLYELYQLCKSAYWAIKLETKHTEISNQLTTFNLTNFNIDFNDSFNLIESEEEYAVICKKIQDLSTILTKTSHKDISRIFMRILNICVNRSGIKCI